MTLSSSARPFLTLRPAWVPMPRLMQGVREAAPPLEACCPPRLGGLAAPLGCKLQPGPELPERGKVAADAAHAHCVITIRLLSATSSGLGTWGLYLSN